MYVKSHPATTQGSGPILPCATEITTSCATLLIDLFNEDSQEDSKTANQTNMSIGGLRLKC